MPDRVRRRSYISALRDTAQDREGPLHVGWQRLRAALRGAGVAPGLWKRSLHARLGPHARLKPTRATAFDLLDSYLRLEARGRAAEGRYLAHLEGNRDSARRIVARLRAAVPELGPLTLADERHAGRQRLLLRAVGASAEIAPHCVAEEALDHDARWVQRTVTVDALVASLNQLLALRGLPFRFLPIDGPEDVAAYLAVDRHGAGLLDEVDFWTAPVEELRGFASWLDAPDVVTGAQVA